MSELPLSLHPKAGTSPASEPASKPINDDIQQVTDIVPDGDVVLHLEHEFHGSTTGHRFRVSSSVLQSRSRYFATLFRGSFGEREHIARRHDELRALSGPISSQTPSSELPEVRIEDLGRIAAVKSLAPLCSDFLHILHGRDLQTTPPVANLANLAVVADRFDALDALRSYCSRKKIFRSLDAKTSPAAEAALSEERVRQRLLAAFLLDFQPWLETYSRRIICKGWVDPDESAIALWWDLPARLEEELSFRRACVLETLQALQVHLLSLYLSPRARQCRLGYDSSAQCDSFQLGESVRFLSRIGTLQLTSTLLSPLPLPPTPDPPQQTLPSDLFSLLDLLRQIPEYQLDRNHSHCGLRTRLLPLLDLIAEASLSIGLAVWPATQTDPCWIDTHRPLLWKRSQGLFPAAARARTSSLSEASRARARSLFMAEEREWGV